MNKVAAYLCLVAIVALLGATDYFVITSSATVSRLVRDELTKVFGDSLNYRDLRASIDGVIVVRNVDFYLKDSRVKIIAADRAEIRFAGGNLQSRPETVYLDDPRISFSDRLLDEIEKMPPGPPLKDRLGPDLPRIVCRGGTLEVIYPKVFRWDTPQAFTIGDLSMTPVAPYRAYVTGRLSSKNFGDWRVAGEIDFEAESYNLRMTCDHAYLGGNIRKTLAVSLLPEWDRYQPDGIASIAVEFSKPPGGEVFFKTTLAMKDMSLTYGGFPYKVDHIHGEMDFFTSGFVIKELIGGTGGLNIRVDGRSNGYAAESDFDIRLDIKNMPLDDTLRAALDTDAKRIWDDFHPSGSLDATGRVLRDYGKDKPVRNPLHIEFKNAQFRFREFPYELRKLFGEVSILSPNVEVKRIVASDGPTKFEINGEIDEITTDPVLDLNIRAKDLPLDFRLKQALDRKTVQLWEEFAPKGTVDVDWHVTKEKGEEPRHHGDVVLKKCESKYKEIPLQVTEIEGEVHYSPERIHFHHLTGKQGEATVALDGEVQPRKEGSKLDLKLDAVGLKLDPETTGALPKEIRDFLQTIKFTGVSNFRSHIFVDRTGEQRKVKFDLALKVADGVFDTSPKITDVQGEVSLTGWIENEKTTLQGPLHFNRLRIAEKRVNDVSCSVLAGGTFLRFNNLQASAYGGTATGTLWVKPSTGEFEGILAADRLDLREFALDTQSFSKEPPSGKVSIEIRDLKGNGSDSKTITGTGKMTITEGALFSVPIFYNLLTLDLLKGERVFTAGTVNFDIAERQFKINALAFQGENVALYGKGTVDFDGNLDIRMKIQTGGLLGIDFILFKIPMRILDIFKDIVAGIHITGTFEKPIIK